MIDQMSNKGFALLDDPTTVAASGAGSGVLNLLLGPGGTGAPLSPTNGQPQGTIAFVLNATSVTGSGSVIATIQTGTDNTNFTNVTGGAFANISNVANTAGVQVVFLDSANLNTYTRIYYNATGSISFLPSCIAVFVPKNP